MKYALILFVLSMPAYANVAKYSAPSDKESSTGMVYDKDGHGYDNADTVRTGQSATLNNNNMNNNNMRNMPQNKMNTLPGRSNCIDNSGRSFASSDAGYTGCLNSMRAR